MNQWSHKLWQGSSFRALPVNSGTACGILENIGGIKPTSIPQSALLCPQAKPEYGSYLPSARGVILHDAPLLSHLGLLIRELELPALSVETEVFKHLEQQVDFAPPLLIDATDGWLHLVGKDTEASTTANEILKTILEPDFDFHSLLNFSDEALELSVSLGVHYGAWNIHAERTSDLNWVEQVQQRIPKVMVRVVETLRTQLATELQTLSSELEQTTEIERLANLEERVKKKLRPRISRLLLLDASSEDESTAIERLSLSIQAKRRAHQAFVLNEMERMNALDDTHLRRKRSEVLRLLDQARAHGLPPAKIQSLNARLAALSSDDPPSFQTRGLIENSSNEALASEGVGHKAANLARIQSHLPGDCKIPGGFIIPTSAYRAHLDSFRRKNPAIEAPTTEDQEFQAPTLIHHLRAKPLATTLRESLKKRLSGREQALWAVRSSSTLEDQFGKSFAGQFRSFYGVQGLDALEKYIREVWLSMWRPHAIQAIRWAGLDLQSISMAVLVQEWIDPEVSGVMRTSYRSHNSASILVNAARGLGAGICDGRIRGDLYWLSDSGTVIESRVSHAQQMTIRTEDPGQTVLAPVPSHQVKQRCLEEAKLERLARLGNRLTQFFQAPVDIEFGFGADDVLYVFQARQI